MSNWHSKYMTYKAESCAEFAAKIAMEEFGVKFSINPNASATDLADYFKYLLRNCVVRVPEGKYKEGDFPVYSSPQEYHTGILVKHQGKWFVIHGGRKRPPKFQSMNSMLSSYKFRGVYRIVEADKYEKWMNPGVDVGLPVVSVVSGIIGAIAAPVTTLGKLIVGTGTVSTGLIGGFLTDVSVALGGSLVGTGFSLQGLNIVIGNYIGIGLLGYGAYAGYQALVPNVPSFPGQQGRADLSNSPTYNLGGGVNRARLEAPMPLVMGSIRMNPDFVSFPHTEFSTSGRDQYWIGKLSCGFGDLEVSAGQVKNTPIEDFVIKQETNYKGDPLINPQTTQTSYSETFTIPGRSSTPIGNTDDNSYTYNSIVLPLITGTQVRFVGLPGGVSISPNPSYADFQFPSNITETNTYPVGDNVGAESVQATVTTSVTNGHTFNLATSTPFTGTLTLVNYNATDVDIEVIVTGGLGIDALTNNVRTYEGASLTAFDELPLPAPKTVDIINPLSFRKMQFDLNGTLFRIDGTNLREEDVRFKIWYTIDDGDPIYASTDWVGNLPSGVRLENGGTSNATFVATGASLQGFRRTIETKPDTISGAQTKYTFYFQRIGARSTNIQVREELDIPAIKLFIPDDRDNYTAVNIFTLLLSTNEQASGRIDDINYLVEAKTAIWDGTKWTTDNHKTSNPAAWFRNFAHGLKDSRDDRLLYGMNLTDDDLDLPSIQAWYEFCESYGLTFDAVFDTPRADQEVLQLLCRAGRAYPTWSSGKLGVILDEPFPVTSQILYYGGEDGDIVAGSLNLESRVQLPAEGIVVDYVDKSKDYGRRAFRIPGVENPNPLRYVPTNYFGMVNRGTVIEQGYMDIRRDYYSNSQPISFSVALSQLTMQVGDVIEIKDETGLIEEGKKYIVQSLNFTSQTIQVRCTPFDERVYQALGEFPILDENRCPILAPGSGIITYRENEALVLPV